MSSFPSESVRIYSPDPSFGRTLAAMSSTARSLREQPLTPTVRSALWAAWADALGFQTELARDGAQVQRRLGTERVDTTVAWKRRIGGRFGAHIELPAGTYSDDTQLRLAVSRCIRASGRFDVEAFSKIELPVFLSYELGAGVGTKAAAHALTRRSVRWNANFFSTKRSGYMGGGGNGAAMRVQPHVWAARDYRPDGYLLGVARDALITHGHPRGILGAALHALVLGSALREGAVPEPARWPAMVDFLRRTPDLMAEDEALTERWLPMWEERAGTTWRAAVDTTVRQLTEQVALAVNSSVPSPRDRETAYAELADQLGGLDPKTRGSGSISAVLSMWLAWTYESDPADGLRTAAGLIGSDTDTVATMAGALLGAVTNDEPPGPLLDRELHVREASRLERLREGQHVDDFPHPDPLHWHPPATLADSVGTLDGDVAIAGLGRAVRKGVIWRGQGKEDVGWQWVETTYGQHLLVKRRDELSELAEWAAPRMRATAPPIEMPHAVLEPTKPGGSRILSTKSSSSAGAMKRRPAQRGPRDEALPDEVEDGVSAVIRSRFDQVLFARLFFHYARQQPFGASKAGIFAGTVAQRLREDEGLDRRENGNDGR